MSGQPATVGLIMSPRGLDVVRPRDDKHGMKRISRKPAVNICCGIISTS